MDKALQYGYVFTPEALIMAKKTTKARKIRGIELFFRGFNAM
jgi:hypothetical protein